MIKKVLKSEAIAKNHASYSTYKSIYRERRNILSKKIVIVIQKYHLYRDFYIANQLEINAYVKNTESKKHPDIVRNKDFLKCIFQPTQTVLGKAIPISGNGVITNNQ